MVRTISESKPFELPRRLGQDGRKTILWMSANFSESHTFPDVLPVDFEVKRIALHDAQVISELGYCPTRAIALRQFRDEAPIVSSHWRMMDYEAREARNRATEASGAGTEVCSAPGKGKGSSYLKIESSGGMR